MRKQLLAILLLFFLPVYLMYGYEVPTTVQKKNILLEEFTGIYCGFCPDGHRIANTLALSQPESTYVIAIHSGSFAKPNLYDPDFRVEEGEEIDTELGAYKSGYPCGTVNRHVFSGASVILPRNYWIKNAKEIHREDAPVNLWIKSEYDGSSRQLNIKVEGYFTADEQNADQFLNVVWTQSGIQGPQNGGGMGDEYVHRHMLRDYISPLWGDQLDVPEKGTYFEKEYSYQLPEDVKGIPVKAEDIEVIAFVTAGRREVLNVIGGKPVYSNYDKPLGATISLPKMAVGARYGYNFFEVVLKNNSDKAITTADFEVTVNGEVQNITWNGHLSSFADMPVQIKIAPYNMNDYNTYKITLVSVNGQNIEATPLEGDFAAPQSTTPTMDVTIQTDLYADENLFLIRDADGNVIKELGPYEASKKAVYKEKVELEAGKTYCLEILDAWGDGMQQPKGYLKIHTDGNDLVEQNYDIKAFGFRSFFSTSLLPSSISKNYSDPQYTIDIRNKQIRMDDAAGAGQMSLYAIDGKCLMQNEGTIMNIDEIPPGIYLLKLVYTGFEQTSKIVIY